jgi:UDP-N-acetyl-2-amino-2-deoxyglucuronate dehydrogenase
MQKLRLGIIGCGHIAKNHLAAVADNRRQIELAAVCDVMHERMDMLVESYKALGFIEEPKKCKDYGELINDVEIDAISVLTPSGLRSQIALAALEKGKHLVLEKPIALTAKDADAIAQKSHKNSLKVQVCHQLRFLPHFQQLKQSVSNGHFGKLVHGTVSIRWNRNDEYYSSAKWRGTKSMDGGILINQCIHAIDMLIWIMGPVLRVYAETGTFLRNIETEDASIATLRFRNGQLGLIEASVCVYPESLEETLAIFGEKGTVCIGGKALNEVKMWQISEHPSFADKNMILNAHSALYKDFVESIFNNRDPTINVKEVVESIRIINALIKSSEIHLPVML